MNMKNWLRKHDACSEGYAWAVSSCSTMQDVWDTAQPEWLIWVATRPGVLDDITLRRFACWCARRVWHLLTDERSRCAIETAERFCDGKATREELTAAKAAALTAARAAARAAADTAARDAATVADTAARAAATVADTAARAAATVAARAAAMAAARAAACAAAMAAAWAAAMAAARYAAMVAANASTADESTAVGAAARAAADATQAQWLRANAKPNFDD
jgi:hypothetical protein